MSACGPSRQLLQRNILVAIGEKADIGRRWGRTHRSQITQSRHSAHAVDVGGVRLALGVKSGANFHRLPVRQ